jgi:sporulation protein YlmC with PRC-barrel domain
MRVRLGASVLGSDDKEVGSVDRLVIDPQSRQILQLVAKQGRMSLQGVIDPKELIVDRTMVSNVDDEGQVHLALTSEEASALREFYAVDYAPLSHHEEFSWTRALGAPLGGGQRSTVTDATTRYTSLPDNIVVVKKGMDVQDREFEKFGELDDIEFDENAEVTGFTVHSGRWRRQEHYHFNVEQVAGVGTDYVRLNLTSDEARAAGGEAEV